MGRERKSKRQLIRDEKKAKKRHREIGDEEVAEGKKRQRLEKADDPSAENEFATYDLEGSNARPRGHPPAIEFFGMLDDDDQEFFRHADEMLETDEFETPAERETFLEGVYEKAEGKELKLASSQSCSRIMERLILLSNTRQKKQFFEAFAGRFISLVTHRFAGHCCEKLFIQSAPVVTRELGGFEETEPVKETEGDDGETKTAKASMEDLFLLTLDELEEHLTFLLSDKFGSHALRVLLIVLSGRSFDQVTTKSLLQSKAKEHISAQGAAVDTDGLDTQARTVPGSFTLAIQKIVEDTTSSMDETALRVLATHPTGNPVLQLLLELDLTLNGKEKEKTDKLLILKLLPEAPGSLADPSSRASDFVNQMMYEPVGSRLMEMIIMHAPAKIFKALNINFFGPRIQTYVRNDVACYPAIKALNRMSKDDLKSAMAQMIPDVPKIVAAKRFNVLKALFDRCKVRQVTDEIKSLVGAICAAYQSDYSCLVPRLCGLEEESPLKEGESAKDKKYQKEQVTDKQKAAAISHGCKLATTLVGIPGSPGKAIQTSLLSLSPEQILHLATSSTPTMLVIKTALEGPAYINNFHKAFVTKVTADVVELANSQMGHNIINAIVEIPSKGKERSVPFHLKEAIMTKLVSRERDLRDTWTGRSVWRTWKGDLWKRRRSEWVRYVKEADEEVPVEEKVWNRRTTNPNHTPVGRA